MPDIGSLQITVDASQAKTAATDLGALTTAGERAEASTRGMGQTFDKVGQSMVQAATGASALSNAYKNSSQQSVQLNETGKQFIAQLNDQIALFGKSTEEILRYRAAQGGIASTAEPLIQKLQELRTAHEAVAAAEAKAAAGQSFLSGLREQIALFGKSSEEVLRYKAAQLGLGDAIEPYIARLRQQQEVQDLATQSALKEAAAQRQAALSKQSNDAFINSLREQAEVFGKSTEDILRYRAAQSGIGAEAEPFIQKLEQQKAAQQAAEAAARGEAIAQREAAQAKQSALGAEQSFLKSLRDQAATYGLTQAEILRYRATQLGVSQDAEKYIKRMEDMSNANHKGGASAAQARVGFQQLHFQITDIVTSLASGQNPFTVLIQQGGQIKDSFGGVGATFRALGSLLTPLRLALGGVAAGLGLVAFGYYEGQKESEAFVKALALTGNQSGVTVNQLNKMAVSIGAVTGRQHEAAVGLAEMAQNGKVSSDRLQEFTQVAVEFARVTGKSIQDVAKDYADLAKDPVQATVKLGNAMGYLTSSLYDQIKALKEQGKNVEAVKVAQEALNRAEKDAKDQILANQGTIERAWTSFIGILEKAKNLLFDIGRPAGADELMSQRATQLAAIDRKLAERKANPERAKVEIASGGLTDDQLQSLRATIAVQQSSITSTERSRRANAELKESTLANANAYAEASELLDRYQSKQEQWVKKERELRNAFAISAKEGNPLNAAKQAQIIADARKQIFGDISKPEQGKDIAGIKAYWDAFINSSQNGEKRLEALRAAGLVGEKEYYDQKRVFRQKIAGDQINELNAENDLLAHSGKTTQDRINNDKQIIDNKRQIAKITANLTADLIIQDTQQSAADRARAKAIQEMTFANDSYIASLKRRFELEVQAVGLGNKDRSRQQEQAAIEEKLQKAKEDAEAFKRSKTFEFTDAKTGDKQTVFFEEDRKQYEALLATAQDVYKRETDAYLDRNTRLDAAQSDWLNGAKRAFANYYDAAKNTSQGFEDLFTDALKGLEDTLTEFISTGKGGFKALVDSILKEFTRIYTVKPLLASVFGNGGDDTGLIGQGLGLVASLFGGGAPVEATYGAASGFSDFSGASGGGAFDQFKFGGYRADGGQTQPNTLYRVNERGPELLNVAGQQYLMMGNQSGSVTPNDAWSGGQQVTQIINFNTTGTVDKRTQTQVGAAAYKGVSAASARNN